MRSRRQRWIAMLGIVTLVLACQLVLEIRVSATTGKLTEGQVKAAYLYNFTQFVEWPSSAFHSANAPLVISVLGKGSSGNNFDALAGRRVHKRAVVVRQISRIEEIGESHVLFICASERQQLSRILNTLRSSPVLTVSDIRHFTDAGGMIGLIARDDRIGFEINLKAARQADLRLSSQLLKLAADVSE